jgi:hypothetical protein
MIPLIISIALTVLVAAITCYNSWKHPNEEKYKKKNRIAIALLISAIITQCLTFYNGYTTSDSLRISQNKIISLQNNLLDTTNRILFTSLNINKLQKEINDLQSEFYKHYVGNNAKPHVLPMGYQKNSIAFHVVNNGKYPISDVHVSMVDNFEVRRDLGTLVIEKVAPYTLNYGRDYNLGVVNPGSAAIFYSRQIPADWDMLYFHLYVYYRTGSYKFYVRYERNKNGEFRITDSHYEDLRTGKEFKFPSPKAP